MFFKENILQRNLFAYVSVVLENIKNVGVLFHPNIYGHTTLLHLQKTVSIASQ